jgi:hypothetical protein
LKERELQKLLKLCPPKIIPQRNATAGWVYPTNYV